MQKKQTASRPAPFSLRLTAEERERLMRAAGEMPLGAYVKACIFEAKSRRRTRRTTRPLEDQKAMAQALALLGQSRIASNLNQIAKAAHLGALPLTPELEQDLDEACRRIMEIRRLLVEALGLDAGGAR